MSGTEAPINNSKVVILNATELKHQIMKLNYQLEKQELTLKQNIKELYYSMQLSTIIRNTVEDLQEDKELKKSVLSSSIEIGSNILLDKLMFRKGAGIKTYLLNAGLKKLISFVIARTNKKQKTESDGVTQ